MTDSIPTQVWLGIAALIAIETTSQCLLRVSSRAGVYKVRWLAGVVGLYFTGLAVWYWVMRDRQIGVLLPLMGANYVTILLAGRVLFGETITLRRGAGIGLIACGFILIAASHHAKDIL